MRFTSAEAKDVRCPLRVDGMYCIGKQCAAWRWWEEKAFPQSADEGYCGMAGGLRYDVLVANRQWDDESGDEAE